VCAFVQISNSDPTDSLLRLSYDAAISKLDKVKSSKKEKEKDRKDAEDELQTARLR
jgi:hypothetical protein